MAGRWSTLVIVTDADKCGVADLRSATARRTGAAACGRSGNEVGKMACRSTAIARPLRAQRLAQALVARAVEAARLLTFLCLTMVIFFQPVLAQERRDPPAIARQPSSQRSVPGHLQRTIDGLAGRAKQAFYARMEPGIPNLILVNILDTRRDLFSVLRDFVRSNFNAAVDALVAEATTDERARAVEHALRIFVEAGQTSASDVLFAEMIERSGADARAHAAALRYSVGLAELPAVLANLTEAPFVAPFGPSGDKALPAFRRAASLDPDDTWTWIVVALKSMEPGAMDRALVEAVRSAQAQDDWRGLAFAMQVFGLALELRGRPADADRAYAGAVQVIRDRSVVAPLDAEKRRGSLPAACCGSAASGCAKTVRFGQTRIDLEESLQLREAAALRNPDGMRETIDLVSCHLQLNMLFHQNGFGAEAKDHLDVAMRLYGAMADRSQFTPTLPIDGGLTSEALLIAGALTLVSGFVLLALYRRRMRVLMRATAKAPVARPPESWSPPPLPGANVQGIPLRSESARPVGVVTAVRPACACRHCDAPGLVGPCALRRGVRSGREHAYVPPGRCRVQLRAMHDLPAGLGLADRARAAPVVGARPTAAWYAARWLCRAAGGRLPDRRARRYTAARGRRNQHRTVLRAADFSGVPRYCRRCSWPSYSFAASAPSARCCSSS